MKLSELRVGDRAEVMAVGSEPVVRRRLMDMGLIRGTRFRVLRVAPLGDPIEIEYKGFLLTMRVKEAEGIIVRKLSEDGNHEGPGKMARKRWRFGIGS
jgi:ferrous iron transport protein A